MGTLASRPGDGMLGPSLLGRTVASGRRRTQREIARLGATHYSLGVVWP